MVSSGNGKYSHEIEIQEIEATTSPNNNYNSNNHVTVYVSTSQRGLLHEQNHIKKTESKFQRRPSQRFHVPFVKKINWGSLWTQSKDWIKNPLNMALFVWIACVAISGAILFLVMTGMLNHAIPSKSQRDTWFEVNNQILNALFTLMCLYQHPKRFHHLVLLLRWREDDVNKLRKIYCKNGTSKPNEWKHMMVVVVLLHVNCFAQYALCGLNVGLPRSKRPAIGVGLCLCVAIGAVAFASVYNIVSPLGRDYENEAETDHELQVPSGGSTPTQLRKSLEKRYSFMARGSSDRIQESNPEWIGGIFDLWDDISLAYLSIFCSCCVFGWNMDRLGFGNMYVHIVTFLLFLLAPFFIFNLAAVNIDNEAVRTSLGLAGFVLCIFGLLYGGFWRIQMRKRFNLPGNDFCFKKPDLSDCFQWLCCCSCSLAQEVRTADYYNVVEDKFYVEEMVDCEVAGGARNRGSDVEWPPQAAPREMRIGARDSYPGPVDLAVDEGSRSPLRFAGVFGSEWAGSTSEENGLPSVVVIPKT